MACGRPKNLENAGGNPLCGRRDWRRNFLTTGNGSRRRGNPRASGKGGNPGASGKGGNPGASGKGGNPGASGKGGNPGASGKGGNPGATARGATPSQPGKGQTPGHWPGRAPSHRRRGNSPPPGEGGNPGTTGNGPPRATGAGQSSATRRGGNPEPPATGDLGPLARENPESPGDGETSGHRHEGTPEPPGEEETLRRWRRGRPPASRQRENSQPPGKGNPEPPGIRATGTPVRLLGPVGGRTAQRTLSNRRDGAGRLGEAPPSHTWRGLVPLCPTRQNRAGTDTPPGGIRPFRPPRAGAASRAIVEFEGPDIAGRAPRACLAPLVGKGAA